MATFDVEIVTVALLPEEEASKTERVVRFKVEAVDKAHAMEIAESHRFSAQPPPGAEAFERPVL